MFKARFTFAIFFKQLWVSDSLNSINHVSVTPANLDFDEKNAVESASRGEVKPWSHYPTHLPYMIFQYVCNISKDRFWAVSDGKGFTLPLVI